MADDIRDVKLELFESQNEIIRLQAEAIDELFRLLVNHVETEELSNLSAAEKVNEAARIRAEKRL